MEVASQNLKYSVMNITSCNPKQFFYQMYIVIIYKKIIYIYIFT